MSFFGIVIAVIFTFLILTFILGFIVAAVKGRSKKRDDFLIDVLSNLSDSQRKIIYFVYSSWKKKDYELANKLVGEFKKSDIDYVVKICGSDIRPREFSSGQRMDKMTWINIETAYVKAGCNSEVAMIIAGIVFHEYDRILEKIYL